MAGHARRGEHTGYRAGARSSRLHAHLRSFVRRDLTRGCGGVGVGWRGWLRWWRHRDGCRCRLFGQQRVDRGGRCGRFAGVGGLDDRFLDGFLGRGLDGFIVIVWVVIQRVVNVLDVLGGFIDVGWIHQCLVCRSQQAAERIGELLSESGQAAADLGQSAE